MLQKFIRAMTSLVQLIYDEDFESPSAAATSENT
jgi:hypothetical protein